VPPASEGRQGAAQVLVGGADGDDGVAVPGDEHARPGACALDGLVVDVVEEADVGDVDARGLDERGAAPGDDGEDAGCQGVPEPGVLDLSEGLEQREAAGAGDDPEEDEDDEAEEHARRGSPGLGDLGVDPAVERDAVARGEPEVRPAGAGLELGHLACLEQVAPAPEHAMPEDVGIDRLAADEEGRVDVEADERHRPVPDRPAHDHGRAVGTGEDGRGLLERRVVAGGEDVDRRVLRHGHDLGRPVGEEGSIGLEIDVVASRDIDPREEVDERIAVGGPGLADAGDDDDEMAAPRDPVPHRLGALAGELDRVALRPDDRVELEQAEPAVWQVGGREVLEGEDDLVGGRGVGLPAERRRVLRQLHVAAAEEGEHADRGRGHLARGREDGRSEEASGSVGAVVVGHGGVGLDLVGVVRVAWEVGVEPRALRERGVGDDDAGRRRVIAVGVGESQAEHDLSGLCAQIGDVEADAGP